MNHTFADELVDLANNVNKRAGEAYAATIIELVKKECIKTAGLGKYKIPLSSTDTRFSELYNYNSENYTYTIEAFKNHLKTLGLKYDLIEADMFSEPIYWIKFK